MNYKLHLQLFADGEGGEGQTVVTEEAKANKQEQTVPKSLFDKKMSEFADLKKKYQEKMTDEEKQQALRTLI